MKAALILSALLTSALAAPSVLTARQHGPVGCSTCSPFPEQNKCHPSTSCIYNWGHNNPSTPGPNYCACAAGLKANPREVGAELAAMWRLPWESQETRVFVRPGIACTTPCDTPDCAEVTVNTNPACM